MATPARIEEKAIRFFQRSGLEPVRGIGSTWYFNVGEHGTIMCTNGEVSYGARNPEGTGLRPGSDSLVYKDGRLRVVPAKIDHLLSDFNDQRMGFDKALGLMLGYAIRDQID